MSKELARYNVVLELITQANEKQLDQIEKKASGLETLFKRSAIAYAGIFSAQAIKGALASIFDITAKFQQYEIILKNATGSQKEANKAIALIKDIGKESVFSVDEMTSAYLKFINRGIKPTREQFVSFTDIAASQGKSIDQLTEAILDATTGEFERLKEFGIKASKEGDKVKLAFRGQSVEVKNTSDAINEALVAFGKLEGIAGSNVTQMDTLTGRMSLLKDSLDELFVRIGNALIPIFNKLISVVSSVVAGIGVFLTAIAKTGKFIEENKVSIGLLVAALVTFNAALFAQNIILIKNNILTKAKAAADLFLVTQIYVLTRAQRVLNLVMRANPFGLVVTAVLALAAGFAALYKKSETVRNIFGGLTKIFTDFLLYINDIPKKLSKLFEGGFIGVFDKLKNYVFGQIKGIIEGVQDVLNGDLLKGFDKILSNVPITGEFYKAGKNAGKSFIEGFEESKLRESISRAASGLGGRGGLSTSFEELRKLQEKQAEEAKKKAEQDKADAQKRLEEEKKRRELRLKKELEAVEKEFEAKEIAAKKTIQNEQKLNDTLELLAKQRSQRLNEVKSKFADGLEALKIENELLTLQKEVIDAQLKLRRVFIDEVEKLFKEGKDFSEVFEGYVESFDKQYNLDGSERGQRSVLLNFFSDPDGAIADQAQRNVSRIIERMKKTADDIAKEGKNDDDTSFLQSLLGLTDEEFDGLKTSLQRAENLIKESLLNILDAESEANEKRIEFQEKRVAKAELLAERGNAKILELEENRLARLQEKQERYAKQRRAIEQAQIVASNALAAAQSIQAITAAFAQGGPAGIVTGIATSLALGAQIAAIIKTVQNSFGSLPTFWDGTELISSDRRFRKNKVSNGRDGYIFRGDGSERMVSGVINSQLDNIPNSQLPAAVKAYKILPAILAAKSNPIVHDNKELITEMKGIKESLESLKMEVSLDADGFIARQQQLIQKKLTRKKYMS